MARRNNLAALAALAGLAYAYNKGKDKEGPSATAAEEEASNARMKAQRDAVSGKRVTNEPSGKRVTNESAYTGTTKNDSNTAKNIGFGGGDNSDKNLKREDPAESIPVKPPKVVSFSDLPTATPFTTITRNYKDPEKQKVYDTLNEKSGANTSSALRSDQLADVSRAVNREAKTSKFARGEFRDVTRGYTNRDDTPAVKAQETYDTLNKKSGAGTSSAQKTDALAVASRAARVADAKRRAAKQRGYKSGGMVAKASSASSRADGIASKGKTRGKIC